MDDELEQFELAPAYDMDLSFNLGNQVLHLHGTTNNNKFNRTTNKGTTTLSDIISEFAETIPRYLEKMKNIVKLLESNYVEKILELAYKNSGVSYFKTDKAKQNYLPVLTMRVAELKQAVKTLDIDKTIEQKG